MAEMVDKQLGNFIGRFLEYDLNSNTALWRQCMRIRVAVDVHVPLVRYKMIKLRSGTLHRVSFKYERLGTFCFLCGLLSHLDRFCPTLFYDDGSMQKR